MMNDSNRYYVMRILICGFDFFPHKTCIGVFRSVVAVLTSEYWGFGVFGVVKEMNTGTINRVAKMC